MTPASSPPSPSDEGFALVRELRTFVNGVERYMAGMSDRHTMHRTDLSALALVMDRQGATPKEISTHLALSPPATSAMLARLEKAGHIRRTTKPDDRRSVQIEVTEQALTVGASMFGILAAHMRPVLASCDDRELAAFAELMVRLNEATDTARDEVHAPLS